jgi:hypothetical protein
MMDKFQKYLPQDTLEAVWLFWTEIMAGGDIVPTIWSLKHKTRRNQQRVMMAYRFSDRKY